MALELESLSPAVGSTLTGVRYGPYSKGKVHLALRPIRAAGEYGQMHDSDSLCGRECEGRSTVWYDLDVLREVGWDNAEHICKRCLAEVGIHA